MGNRKKGLSRRDFIASTLTGAASIGFLGATDKKMNKSVSPDVSGRTKKKLISRPLGNTGIDLPVVNMGVMNSLNPELVSRSYEMGVRHFDTAASYMRGQNEIMVGKVIKEMGVRDKVIIGTKVFIPEEQRPKLTPDDVKGIFLKTADESLSRLQMDYVDILYVHNVQDLGFLNNPGIKEALHQLKEKKKVRHTGFSAHMNMTELVEDAVMQDFYEVIQIAFNYAMSDDAKLAGALKAAHAKGIGLIAMKTQCMQYWYKEYVPSEKQAFYQGNILHTAVLKWVLKHDFITCAIPGFTTFNQMEQDFAVAYDLDYTAEERKFLEDRNVKSAAGTCLQCSGCLASCPKGMDVPTLMRTHMYAACYANYWEARSTLANLPQDKNLHACISCNACTASCVRRIDVPRRIRELKIIFA